MCPVVCFAYHDLSCRSYHNVYYMMRLMRTLRESIIDGTFPDFVRDFMYRMYPDGQYPEVRTCFYLKNLL
eukprot:COSAG05_NODE_100_length_19386_cov_396.467154_8_plen_70_part_00